jgi:hypothetical protein
MTLNAEAPTFRPPSYVMNADGVAEAVLVDIKTWKLILEQLEDRVDQQLLHQARSDLEILAGGKRPSGWQSWEVFEAELDALEQAGELPD